MNDKETEALHAALEPESVHMAAFEIGALLSIAISLKRIADALETDPRALSPGVALATIAERMRP